MHPAIKKAPAFLAVVLLIGGCSSAGTPRPGPDRGAAGIAWGTPVDGIQIGITRVSCPVQDQDPGIRREVVDYGTVGVGIYVRNLSHDLPAACDGSVRLALWHWRIGKPNPGTAGGMGVTGPVDPTRFPLQKKLLDGKVRRLESYLLPCRSIHPQQTMTGTFTVTFYYTDAQGRPLGGKWRGELKTGPAPVQYLPEPPLDVEGPDDGGQRPRAPRRGVPATELLTHRMTQGQTPRGEP